MMMDVICQICKVDENMHKKQRIVSIKGNESCLCDGDEMKLVKKLFQTIRNPQTVKIGTWRQYLPGKNKWKINIDF